MRRDITCDDQVNNYDDFGVYLGKTVKYFKEKMKKSEGTVGAGAPAGFRRRRAETPENFEKLLVRTLILHPLYITLGPTAFIAPAQFDFGKFRNF